MGSVSDELGERGATLWQQVDALEEKALVRWEPYPVDRRAPVVEYVGERVEMDNSVYGGAGRPWRSGSRVSTGRRRG